MNSAGTHSPRWLHGPVTDLLFGCGLLYALAFLVFAFAGATIRTNQPGYLLPLLILLFSAPHYGATLVRVYEQRQSRREYAFFAVWATAFVFLAFLAGINNDYFGAILLTIYLTWSPWHYTGQNYGLAMMFLRRRGVEVSQGLRRWFYASFVLSFALVFSIQHSVSGAASDLPVTYDGAAALSFLPLGIPNAVTAFLVPAVGGAYVLSLLVSFGMLLSRSRWRDLVPSAALCLTQALWFSIPLVALHFNVLTGLEPVSWDFRTNYFLWIAVGHSLQYLWVTSFFAKSSKQWTGTAGYYGKVLLAGTAIWVLPVMLFSAQGLGRLSVDTGLSLVLASAVNIHHFILDGAIWKLRNSKIASILIRRSPSRETLSGEEAGRRWIGRGIWTVAGVAVLVQAFVFWNHNVAYDAALDNGDLAGAEHSLNRLAWFGYDQSKARFRLGRKLGESGDLDAAMAQMQRSVKLRPNVSAFDGMAVIHQRRKDYGAALQAYEKALELEPGDANLLHRIASLHAKMGEESLAREYLNRALALDPSHRDTLRALNDFYAWAASLKLRKQVRH